MPPCGRVGIPTQADWTPEECSAALLTSVSERPRAVALLPQGLTLPHPFLWLPLLLCCISCLRWLLPSALVHTASPLIFTANFSPPCKADLSCERMPACQPLVRGLFPAVLSLTLG